jgi:hypothetical protein
MDSLTEQDLDKKINQAISHLVTKKELADSLEHMASCDFEEFLDKLSLQDRMEKLEQSLREIKRGPKLKC